MGKGDIGVWRVRAAAWEFLAFSLRYPDASLAEALALGEWAEASQEIASQLGLRIDERFDSEALAAQDALAKNASEWLHTIRVEATRLFIGEQEPACSPFEGVWRAIDEGVNPLLFVNPHSLRVERFCKDCGLEHPEGTNVPLDHVVSECELLQYLAMIESGMAEPFGGILRGDLPGGSPASAYTEFLQGHAFVWFPRFAAELLDGTCHPFYRAVALFMMAVMEESSVYLFPDHQTIC